MSANTLLTERMIAQRLEAMLGLPCRAQFCRPDPDELDEDGKPFPPGWCELRVIVTDQASHRMAGTETQLNLTDLKRSDRDFAERFLEPMVAILRLALSNPAGAPS